jgi:hypothetical protein
MNWLTEPSSQNLLNLFEERNCAGTAYAAAVKCEDTLRTGTEKVPVALIEAFAGRRGRRNRPADA